MITHSSRHRAPAARIQSGIVLITGMIFMVILTLIVLAALRSGALEERMASNARNRQIALQAAEAVLRDAEVATFTVPAAPFDPFTPSTFSSTCANGYCTKPAAGSTPRWKTLDWSDSSTTTRSFASNTSNISTGLVPNQPRYVIELATSPTYGGGGAICPTIVYRITARGVGQDSSEVFVQSLYRTQPAKC
jgi:type IV pilus assembly protein PilX